MPTRVIIGMGLPGHNSECAEHVSGVSGVFRQWEHRALGYIALGVVVLAAAVAIELFGTGIRQFWTKQPLTAGIVSGGLILAPLVFLVERWVARRTPEARKSPSNWLRRSGVNRRVRPLRRTWKRAGDIRRLGTGAPTAVQVISA